MTRITPVPSGWNAVARDTFYPDDLPEDWRLAYFATQFPGVLVPGDLWLRAAPGVFSAWADETPSHFRFYLDLTGEVPGRPDPATAGQELGERLGGLVGDENSLRRFAGSDIAHFRRVVPGAGIVSKDGRGLAIEVRDGLIGDLRAARAWLEQVAADAGGAPVLALTGRAGFEALEQWQLLVRLIGFA
jgi:hypothetical protein